MAQVAKTYSAYYTVAEWERWQDQWELIDGLPYSMLPPPTPLHQRISLNIAKQLDTQLASCEQCKVYLPIDWVVSEDTVVQPDILVVCKEIKGNRLDSPPTLIFEVLSPSTERKDRNEKFNLYESKGVKYYVIVGTENNVLEVYILENGKYKKEKPSNKITFNLGTCQVDFDIKAIW